MRNFKTFTEAVEAAEKYFKETFNHSGKISYIEHEIKEDASEVIKFQSKDNEECTFTVIIAQ